VNAKEPARCSPTDALNLWRPAFKDVVAAADKLTQATHAGLNLYVNSKKVHAAFLPHVLVVGECQPDEEWTARVTSTVKVGGISPSDQCEFEVDQVKAAAAAAEAATAEAATARADLEQARAALQAATEQMEKAEARAQAAEAHVEPPRRRPGRKPAHPDWRLEAAAFTHRFFRKEKRMPSAGEVAEHLQTKYDGWEPDETDIRDLLRFLHRE